MGSRVDSSCDLTWFPSLDFDMFIWSLENPILKEVTFVKAGPSFDQSPNEAASVWEKEADTDRWWGTERESGKEQFLSTRHPGDVSLLWFGMTGL